MIAYASSLDQAGPITKSAEDAALLLNVMAGADDKDSTSLTMPKEDFTRDLNAPLTGLRIGLPKQYFTEQLNPAIADAIRTAVGEMEKLGAVVKEIELPNSELALSAYYVIAPAEASTNLSRFDGVRYGYRCENPKDLEDLYKRSRSEGFGEEVKRRIMIGTYALSAGYYDALLSQGAEDSPPCKGRLRSGFRRRRRHYWTHNAEPGLWPRLDQRLGHNVPRGHLHDRAKPRRPAGHFGSSGLCRRPARRHANHRH
jgi:Asp-tRNA(Asn)/Glu-tRNA(Gln) amidotransferase A subunit family amidase